MLVKRICPGLGALALIAVATTAGAQTSGDENTGLEEIIVTAQKRSQDFQDLAISAIVITGADLEQKGITQIQEAIREAPGVKVQNIAGTGSGRVFIRGIGTTSGDEFDAIIANGVSLNLDGINSNNASNLLSSMFDVERVEVLKGPQGTLYGSSALGGVVNVITTRPKDEFEGSVRVQAGNYAARTYQGMINIPITDNFAIRATVQQDERDGYVETPEGISTWPEMTAYAIENQPPAPPGAPGYPPDFVWPDLVVNVGGGDWDAPIGNQGKLDNTSYRVKALWGVTDDLSVLLTYDYAENAGTSPTWLLPSDVTSGDLLCCRVFLAGPPPFATPQWYETRHYYRENETLTADIEYSFGGLGDLAFTISSNEIRDKGQELSASALRDNDFNEQTQDVYELRLSSPAESNVVWVAGVYYQSTDRKGSSFNTTDIVASPVDTYNFLRLGKPFTNSNAYAQITYPLSDDLRLTAGGRYSNTEDAISYMLYSTTDPACPDGSCIVDESAVYESKDGGQSNFTWKLGFEYDLNDASMLYGHVATGYKAGGVQFRDQSEPITTLDPVVLGSYKPEESTSVEIGAKNRLLDNTLQLNAALFYTKWDNMQLNTFTCVVVGCDWQAGDDTRTVWENAETSTQYGLELDTVWLVSDAGQLRASLSLMKGEYGATSYIWGAPGFNGIVNLDGRSMAQTPDYAGYLSYAHTFNLFNNDLVVTLQEEFSAEYETTHEYFFAGHTQPSYNRTNLMLAYYTDSFTVNAFWRNIENETTIQSVFPFGVQGGEPELYGLSVTFDF